MSPLNRYTRRKPVEHVAVPRQPRPPRRPLRRRWADGLQVLRQRWSAAMPKFFRVVCWLSALVGGTALAVNTAIMSGGGQTHEWWQDIYPYLIGIPAGAAFVAKFTQNYDKNGEPIRKHRPADAGDDSDRTVISQDIDHLQATPPPGPPSPDEIPTADDAPPAKHEIDPYDGD